MGFLEVLKAVFVPALIAAAIYFLGALVLLPLIRRHRARYSQYLPLDSISQHTTSFRDRFSDAVTRLVVPRRMVIVDAAGDRRGSEGEVFGDEEADRMVGFDVGRVERQVRGADVTGARRVEEV